MYRVLIVDDEPIIRGGISAFIDWEKEGASVAEFANGAEALALIESGACDILITDIKMPVMDGIELMKQALALCPWVKVILISNHSDFDYVKEGLKLGAVDYLLKLTLNRDDLLAVLRRSISMLEEERRKVFELKSYQQSALYLERKRAEQEIKRLIVQEQALSSWAAWFPAWLERSYACVYLMLDAAEEWKENHGYLYVQLLLEELQEAFYEHSEEGSALLAAESSLFLIFPDPEGEARQWLFQWKERLEAEWGISTSVGLTVKRGASRILAGYFGSLTVCQRRFFEGTGGLYTASEADTARRAAERRFEPEYDWEPFFEIIRSGEPVSFAVDLALERWKSGMLSPEKVQQEAVALLAEVCRLHADTGALLPERHEQLRKTETLEQLAAFMICELEEIGKSFIPKLLDNGYGGQLITKALEYIASHYTENLTLQSVADTVHLSKSYFSLLFKKQTERTFIDYLIELRIREAKRLLTQNDRRISDVAKAAGFKDVKYFSKVFKKSTGYTPMEYRESTKCQLFFAE